LVAKKGIVWDTSITYLKANQQVAISTVTHNDNLLLSLIMDTTTLNKENHNCKGGFGHPVYISA